MQRYLFILRRFFSEHINWFKTTEQKKQKKNNFSSRNLFSSKWSMAKISLEQV